MRYWLNSQGKAPSGPMCGEDAIPFNPNTIAIKQIGQGWKIADGNNWLLDFGPAQGNAKAAFHFIKQYGFTFICFAGRLNPPMIYFRK